MFEWLKQIVFKNDSEPPINDENLNQMQQNTEQAIQDVTKTLFSEDNLYDSTSTYKLGDIVAYEKKIYKCITAITEGEEFDTTKWEETNLVKILSDGVNGDIGYALLTTTVEIAENTDFEIGLNYIVGNNSLEIYYMGEKLVKDEHYIEVGDEGTVSNIIQFYDWGQSVPVDRLIEFIVRGDV